LSEPGCTRIREDVPDTFMEILRAYTAIGSTDYRIGPWESGI